MRVLVSGGAGFIGGHLVEALVRGGHEVRVADNLSTGHLKNLDEVRHRIEFVNGDLADPEVALRAAEGMDAISHHAAVPSVPRSINNPLEAHASCATTTLNLLFAASKHRVKRFVYAASSSAYGDGPELPKRETMRPEPRSPYAAAKLAGEGYVEAFSACYGLDAVALRYFNIFGPRQDPSSPYSGVIARFMLQMTKGERPTIFGDGSQTRDFTYVSNAVHANLLALNAPERLPVRCMNIGTGRQISLLELIKAFNEVLGTNIEPIFAPGRAGDVKHSVAALDLARNTLGYRPIVNFKEGLALTLLSEKETVRAK